MVNPIAVDRVQGLSGSVAVKRPVACATTTSIALNGLQTVDGVTVAAGDRVLVKNQSTQSENGIYEASTSDWARAIDFNKTNDVVRGTVVNVVGGSTNGGLWGLTTADPVIGTSSLVFEPATVASPEAGSSEIPALPNPSGDDGGGWVLTTNGATKAWALASTLSEEADNTFAVRSFTAAGGETTVTLPFSYVVGGKNLIVMVNGLVGYPGAHYTEDSTSVITFTTALTAGDRVRVIANIRTASYEPTDPSLAALQVLTPAANKLPYFTSSSAAALADLSTYVREVLGSADAAALRAAIGAAEAGSYSQLGVGQVWTDVTSSRAAGITYQNTSGKPIQVSVQNGGAGVTSTFAALYCGGSSANVKIVETSSYAGTSPCTVTAIIPAGHYYKYEVSYGGGTVTWVELR